MMLAIAISVVLGVALLSWAHVRTEGDLNWGFLAAVGACLTFWAILITIVITSL